MRPYFNRIRSISKFKIQIKIVEMISACLTRRHSPSGDGSKKVRKTTVETEESNTENQKESVWNSNSPAVEDWIENERKIELQIAQQQPRSKRTHFKLPPRNYSNKWTPDFQIVYHRYPPKSSSRDAAANRNHTNERIQPEVSHNWGKSIDTEFSNILIEDAPSKSYYSPVPYGFDVNRSRIIVGDRTLLNFVDCTFKEFVTRFTQLEKTQSHQSKGIKLTCKRRPSK